ncbi:MAG: RNA polymerase sigma factor [Muribaculaceae bacterium]|nr:RNA polymerase sigma factor [Muribaculaceae bacterium]MDE6300025.1 RNA polymerase sigma factor [Muribaculaceae bacterium]
MKTDILTSSFLALRDRLHRSALGYLKNHEDARDALQDTFFNLWKNQTVETTAEAGNKLFAVLRNICIDRLRKPQMLPLDESNADRIEASPSSYENIGEYESLLIAGLTDIQKLIYGHVTHDYMEYEEIAKTLNMSVEAVRKNMSRARKKIRDNYNHLEK